MWFVVVTNGLHMRCLGNGQVRAALMPERGAQSWDK
jgi:hypothetical protein